MYGWFPRFSLFGLEFLCFRNSGLAFQNRAPLQHNGNLIEGPPLKPLISYIAVILGGFQGFLFIGSRDAESERRRPLEQVYDGSVPMEKSVKNPDNKNLGTERICVWC